ncbi:MAG: hypothetical protein ABI779_11635 [Acidobacteriota bacterium]
MATKSKAKVSTAKVRKTGEVRKASDVSMETLTADAAETIFNKKGYERIVSVLRDPEDANELRVIVMLEAGRQA